VHAKPIGLDLQQDVVTIDQGSADGIAENMPVISQEKIVYGKVTKVYNNFSEVQLISAKTSVTDVKIQSDDPTATAINGAIKGNGGLGIYLDLVAADAQINQNDVLVTSGLDGIYPRDLLVGRIDSWNKNDVKPFQTAKVSSFSDIKNAENLFVIANYKRQK
jgi:rod shape-determining protein MreC